MQIRFDDIYCEIIKYQLKSNLTIQGIYQIKIECAFSEDEVGWESKNDFWERLRLKMGKIHSIHKRIHFAFCHKVCRVLLMCEPCIVTNSQFEAASKAASRDSRQ